MTRPGIKPTITDHMVDTPSQLESESFKPTIRLFGGHPSQIEIVNFIMDHPVYGVSKQYYEIWP